MLQATTLSPLVKNVDRKEEETPIWFSARILSLFNCKPFVWGLMHYKSICLHMFSVGFQKHGYYFKIKAVTGMRCPEHGRWESDLLLVLCADLRADFFGKGGQVWKWLFPPLEASPKRDRAEGAARCILYTDITNKQKAPYVQDNRNAVNILIACTLEQICCCPMHAAFTYSFPPWPCGFAVLVAGPLPKEWGLSCPTSDALKQKWQWAW